MTVLVTGASGHIGANLVRALLDEGREVRALVRSDKRALTGLDVERFNGDLLDTDSLLQAMRGVRVVYHLAAHISVDGDREGVMGRINIVGTKNIVSCSLKAGVERLIHFSSIHALASDPVEEVIDETRAAAAGKNSGKYDRTKAAAEREVQQGVGRGLNAVIVNPTAVLGPFDFKPSRMGEVLLLLCKRKMPALVAGGYDWVDVRDVVRGAIQAETRGRAGERYLLSGEWHSVAEFAALVEQFSGVRCPRFVSPTTLASIGAPFAVAMARLTGRRPLYTREALRVLKQHRHISHQKATDEFGYTARPLAETVRDTIQWFRQAGLLKSNT